jgi:hypothetical protein
LINRVLVRMMEMIVQKEWEEMVLVDEVLDAEDGK